MVKTFADPTGNLSSSEQGSSRMQSALGDAREVATDVTERVTSTAREAMDNPQKFTRDTVNSMTRFAQEKPFEALAIAAGLAFVVGALWKK